MTIVIFTKEQQLTDLLADLLGPDELRELVLRGTDGQNVARNLPSVSNRKAFAAEVVDVLRLRGALDAAFFHRLSQVRPDASDRIQGVRSLWISEPSRTPPREHHLPADVQGHPSSIEHPAHILVMYSHRDQVFVDQLRAHLTVFQRRGLIRVWTDSEITAGVDWRSAVEEQIARAQIVLILVSADLLASDIFADFELPRLLDRSARGGLRVVPIVVRPCMWQTSLLRDFAMLPRDGKPLSTHRDVDLAWVHVAREIQTLLAAPAPPRGEHS